MPGRGPMIPGSSATVRITRGDWIAAVLVGNAGVISLALQPLLLGPLVATGLLDNSTIGWAAFVETLALGIASFVGPTLLRRGRLRGKLAFAGIAAAMLNCLTISAGSTAGVIAIRGLCGVAEGTLLSGTVLIVLASIRPDRANAGFMAASTTLSALLAYFIPTLLVPTLGPRMVFVVPGMAALIATLAALTLRFVPPATILRAGHRSLPPMPALFALGGLLLQNAAIGSAWAFLERVGAMARFTPEALGVAATAGLVGQVVGPLLVALFAYRLPAAATLGMASVVQAFMVIVLGFPGSAAAFGSASFIIGFLWIGSIPLAIRCALDTDPSGQAAVFCVSAQMLGLAIGPAIVAELVTESDVSHAYQVAGVLLALAALCFFTSRVRNSAHRAPQRQEPGR